jgi:hypothetical protein
VANPDDRLFLSDAPRIVGPRDFDFEAFGSQLAGIAGKVAGEAAEKDIESGIAATNNRLADLEKQEGDMQRAFARLVSEGLPEDQSPYFHVGVRKAHARLFATQWATEAEQRIIDSANRRRAVDPATGIPPKVESAEEILGTSFKAFWDSAAQTNPDFLKDEHFLRELGKQRQGLNERLLGLASQAKAEAVRIEQREVLQSELIGMLRGFDFDTDADEATMTSMVQAVSTWMSERHLESVANPHELLFNAVSTAVEEATVSDGYGAALDLFQRLRGLSVNGVALDSGKYAPQVARLGGALFENRERDATRTAREEAEELRKELRGVKATDLYRAAIGARKTTEFDLAVKGIRDAINNGAINNDGKPLTSETIEALIGDFAVMRRQLTELDEGALNEQTERVFTLMNQGKFDEATVLAQTLPAASGEATINTIERRRADVENVLNRNVPFQSALKALGDESDDIPGMNDAEIDEYRGRLETEIDTIIQAANEEVAAAPPEKRREVAAAATAQIRERVGAVRAEKAAKKKEFEGLIAPVLTKIRDGVDAAGDIAALNIPIGEREKLLEENGRRQDAFDGAIVETRDTIEALLTNAVRTADIGIEEGEDGTFTAVHPFIEAGLIKAEIDVNKDGAPFVKKAIFVGEAQVRRITDEMTRTLLDHSRSMKDAALARKEGLPAFKLWVQDKISTRMPDAIKRLVPTEPEMPTPSGERTEEVAPSPAAPAESTERRTAKVAAEVESTVAAGQLARGVDGSGMTEVVKTFGLAKVGKSTNNLFNWTRKEGESLARVVINGSRVFRPYPVEPLAKLDTPNPTVVHPAVAALGAIWKMDRDPVDGPKWLAFARQNADQLSSGLTPPDAIRFYQHIGVDYKKLVSISQDQPLAMDWRLTPVFANDGELFSTISSKTEKSRLFRILGLTDATLAEFVAYQRQAIARITP